VNTQYISVTGFFLEQLKTATYYYFFCVCVETMIQIIFFDKIESLKEQNLK